VTLEVIAMPVPEPQAENVVKVKVNKMACRGRSVSLEKGKVWR
jgi:uncharacterized Zn-finger protein